MTPIYLAYLKSDNTLFGRVDFNDLKKFRDQGMNIIETTPDKVKEVERQFRKIPISINAPKQVIQKQQQGFNYELIPKKAIPWIRKAYDSDNFKKMKEFRLKYKVADQCPTCTGAAQAYEKRIWQNYFERVLVG